MNFQSGTAVWGLTSQGASFVFDFYLAISGAKTPRGALARF
jgi:hypothetical protein